MFHTKVVAFKMTYLLTLSYFPSEILLPITERGDFFHMPGAHADYTRSYGTYCLTSIPHDNFFVREVLLAKILGGLPLLVERSYERSKNFSVLPGISGIAVSCAAVTPRSHSNEIKWNMY